MKVVFHGSLAKKFGKDHSFNAATAHLITRGLILQLGDEFEEVIKSGKWHIVPGKPDRAKTKALEEQEVHSVLSCDELHFYPAVEGKSNAAKIIVGVILIIAAFYTGGATATFLMSTGVGLVAGGIAGMLAKRSANTSSGTGDSNYFFNTSGNTDKQGIPIPLVYGRVKRATSVVIDLGMIIG